MGFAIDKLGNRTTENCKSTDTDMKSGETKRERKEKGDQKDVGIDEELDVGSRGEKNSKKKRKARQKKSRPKSSNVDKNQTDCHDSYTI